MYNIYNIVLIIILILFSPVLIGIFIAGKKFRAGFKQKCGVFSKDLVDIFTSFHIKPVWFHAVSVGECLAIVDMVKIFHDRHPDIPVILSTVTYTGQELAKKHLGKIATIIYYPYDIGFIVSKVINLITPRLVVITETEIWPNFAFNLSMKNIPFVLINGRLSPKSFSNYKKFSFFMKIILNKFSWFYMQSVLDAERIISIGAPKEKVIVAGNLKYDISPKLLPDDIEKLRQNLYLNSNDKVIILGSSHKGEEEILLDIYSRLKKDIQSLKLILVPRHPERYEEVIALLKNYNFKFSLRSKKENFEKASIMLLDTMGELSSFYSVADIAFIGGTMIPKGGHNPLEASIYSVPVVVGPYTFNFSDITTYMLSLNATLQVPDKEELYSVFYRLLTDTGFYNKIKEASKDVFKSNKGATEITLKIIDDLL